MSDATIDGLSRLNRVSAGALALVALALCGAAQAQSSTIRIVSGTYGANCGASHGNLTHDAARRCDGHVVCAYTPHGPQNAHAAAMCRRAFVAEWRCDRADLHTATLSAGEPGSGDTLVISCAIERGAGK